MSSRVVVLALAALAATPAAAMAAGGPVGPIQAGTGVGVPTGPDRYVAIRVGSRTLVEHLRDGNVQRSRLLRGNLGVPAAAYDGSTTGLSADVRRLVLEPMPNRLPQKRTDLLVLDAPALRVIEHVRLPGWFTVDAISPDGSRLYLIHYRHGDVLRYEVRAYDLDHRRLLARPIVDPREPDEKMLGTPMARTMSADGRWAYTLYARPNDAPFIHALDTEAGTAACIDLDALAGADASTMHLVAPRAGGPLRVVDQSGTTLALVDRRTFGVSRPLPEGKAANRGTATAGGDGGPPWVVAGVALAVLAGLSLIALVRRRRYERSASLRNAS